MNRKQTIRLNESQFNNLVKKVVKESVKKVLKESTNNLLVNGGYVSKEMEPYFRAASKDSLISIISNWVYNTTNKDAAVELLNDIQKHVHVPNDILADYHLLDNDDNDLHDFGSNDSYTRHQEMRDPWGGY